MPIGVIKQEVEANVEGLGAVHKFDAPFQTAPFDQSLASLKDSGMNYPITARDLAYARRREGANSSLSKEGSYIREGLIYAPNMPVLVLSHSPLLTKRNSEKAFKSHRNISEFYLDAEKFHRQAEEDKDKQLDLRRVFALDKIESYDIPTNRFSSDELTLFLFRDQAGNYGNFLRENKINEVPFLLLEKDYVNKKDNAFARQLWIYALGNVSTLDGRAELRLGHGVRGVLGKTSDISSH